MPVPLPNNFAQGRDSLRWRPGREHEFPVPEGYFLGPNAEGIGRMGPARDSWFSYLIWEIEPDLG